MALLGIALANIRAASHRDESLAKVIQSMEAAAKQKAAVICFPECYLPGYRIGQSIDSPDSSWLEESWYEIDKAAARLGIAVILGTERVANDEVFITARVTNAAGECLGFQDKVQLDPSEEAMYSAGTERRLFHIELLTFGVVICHEGWRYPETVRWSVRRGAHIVFHPHFDVVEDPAYLPGQFADPANSFHEKAALCRAAENTCYFATVNCALAGSTTTSAIIDPDGKLISYQPHGLEGILVTSIETDRATGYLARRLKPDY